MKPLGDENEGEDGPTKFKSAKEPSSMYAKIDDLEHQNNIISSGLEKVELQNKVVKSCCADIEERLNVMEVVAQSLDERLAAVEKMSENLEHFADFCEQLKSKINLLIRNNELVDQSPEITKEQE
jgi:predicted RNase H-like nuclease (RuvC/YqgF family)